MTYKVNGIEISPQPTTGKWLARQLVGVNGAGRPIYTPTRQFEMGFNLMSSSEFDAFQTYYLSIAATGSAIVDLPRYTSSWEFHSYSGCYIHEPEFQQYFAEHPQTVKLLITNIVTEK